MVKSKEPSDPIEEGAEDPDQARFDVTHKGMQEATGSRSEQFAINLFNRAIESIWHSDIGDPDKVKESYQAAYDALRGIKPRDEVEGMLAAQMVASHNAAMECMRRAMIPSQSLVGRDSNLKHAVKLMGLYERQLATLDKRRGKGKQKITVEHVNVHEGGQAIVGNVSAAGPAEGPTPPTLEDDSSNLLDGEELRGALEPKPSRSTSSRSRKAK